MKLGLYAGSFDPPTRGHMDVLEQACAVFDQMIFGIGINPKKTRTFDLEQTCAMVRESLILRGLRDRVAVVPFSGALVRFAEEQRADAIVRGMRQISDFNDEFVQHGINTKLSRIPICYFICRTEFLHISSSNVKELARLGLDCDWAVDPPVATALKTLTTTSS